VSSADLLIATALRGKTISDATVTAWMLLLQAPAKPAANALSTAELDRAAADWAPSAPAGTRKRTHTHTHTHTQQQQQQQQQQQTTKKEEQQATVFF
jgi:hypothetical protein